MAVSTVLSLASGGGGLDLGINRVLSDARTICYVENEVTAAAVLVESIRAGYLHDAPIWTDLKFFDAEPWRELVDGIIGGYPCQPFSVAGKRLGSDDPRHLWPYIADIVRTIEPRWCFFENVGGHLRLGFREVAEDLRDMGYRVAATLVTASEVGAPHKRERLFIMAHSYAIDGDRGGDRGTRRGAEPPDGGGAVGDASGLGRRAEGDDCIPTGRLDRAGNHLQWPPGPSDDWGMVPERLWPAEVESEVRGVPDGLARTDLLRVYGNGVVPQQAELAFRELWSALSD